MECKSALTEAKGDLAEADEVVLRKRGIALWPGRRAPASPEQGLDRDLHPPGRPGFGVMVEVNCESDFVARTAYRLFQELRCRTTSPCT